jgi:uncharacterized protein YdiU (UPF0061 family)
MTLPDKITIELTRAEALVLYEYLRRCDDDEGRYEFVDQAEQRAVWNLEMLVQPQLPEVFAPNYGALVKFARDAIRDPD